MRKKWIMGCINVDSLLNSYSSTMRVRYLGTSSPQCKSALPPNSYDRNTTAPFTKNRSNNFEFFR